MTELGSQSTLRQGMQSASIYDVLRLISLIGILLLGIPSFTKAQAAESATAEEVIARCVEALGGEAAWRAIETLELTGRHTSFSHPEEFLLRRKRPNLYFFDHNETKARRVIAYDGETAWWQTGLPVISTATWPVEMPRIYQPAVALEAEFSPPMIDHQAKGHEIRWIGETRFDGETYLELEIRRRQNPGDAERWFLDPDSFLPVLSLTRRAYHGYLTEQLRHFDDYREVSGVQIPHRVETELGNDFLLLEVSSVRTHLEIDDAIFQRPLPAGMGLLKSLAGRWQVTIEHLDDPIVHPEKRKTWKRSETTSVIHSRAAGSLLEEKIDISTDRPRRARRMLSYDRFREVYRLVHFDTFSQHLNVLEGKLGEDGRVVLTNLETGTPIQIFQQTLHAREILHDIRRDSFKLDREVSPDGGEHWGPALRMTYTRIAEEP